MSKTIQSGSKIAAALAAGLLLIAGSGCAHHHSAPGATYGWEAGPPAWAPAHGARHKRHDGAVLVFVKEIDAYRVNGHRNHYFHRDRYYRQHGVHWERARRIQGPWVTVELRALPPGLKRHHERHQREHRHATERRRDERERAKLRKLARKQRGPREEADASRMEARGGRRNGDAF